MGLDLLDYLFRTSDGPGSGGAQDDDRRRVEILAAMRRRSYRSRSACLKDNPEIQEGVPVGRASTGARRDSSRAPPEQPSRGCLRTRSFAHRYDAVYNHVINSGRELVRVRKRGAVGHCPGIKYDEVGNGALGNAPAIEKPEAGCWQ